MQTLKNTIVALIQQPRNAIGNRSSDDNHPVRCTQLANLSVWLHPNIALLRRTFHATAGLYVEHVGHQKINRFKKNHHGYTAIWRAIVTTCALWRICAVDRRKHMPTMFACARLNTSRPVMFKYQSAVVHSDGFMRNFVQFVTDLEWKSIYCPFGTSDSNSS